MSKFIEGQQLFEEEKYAEAKALFVASLEAESADQKKLKMWIRKCDTHISDAVTATSTPEAAVKEAEAPSVKEPAKAKPLIRHEWFQSPSALTFSFFVRNRKQEDVSVDIQSKAMGVTIKLEEGKEFQATFDPFFADVDPASLKIEVRAPKVEITVNKGVAAQWPTLEGTSTATGQGQVPSASVSKGQGELPSAYTKPKKFDISDEDVKDADGTDGTTRFFKEIFSNGTDEQRRAMMKSFQQSGGTVLSTNWEDIGARDVKCEAPKGMEVRKWEQ